MKRFADHSPGKPPSFGFLAPCSACGLVVVHSNKHMAPLHMHRYSKLCKDRAAARRKK